MQNLNLSDNINIKVLSEDTTHGTFAISGLYPGYGLTLANSLRRALLSSLPGAAITHVKITGADHQFTTIPGVVEDVIEITLNLKKIRFKLFSDGPETLQLKMKGEKTVTAGDIKSNSNVEIVNPSQPIATLTTKNAELNLELTVDRGLGYSPVDSRKEDKLSVGLIAIDAFFSPVLKVNYTIDNIRVGDRTDYNEINLNIETDGTISPKDALSRASAILSQQFHIISGLGEDNSATAKDEESDHGVKSKNKDKKEDKE